MKKHEIKYVALVRVSSREQEREGFSLDVQQDGIKSYAERQGGTIAKLFRIAETATKPQERKVFRELLAYIRQHAHELNGLLLYKLDRGARNLFDYVELERLESELNIPLICVTQPTENTPAGRMSRRMLASIASFYTEQQSIDVREGHARRVKNGLFVGLAPYGYRNVRVDGRGLIEIDEAAADNVRRIFELYAYHRRTLDTLGEALVAEGRVWTANQPQFTRSKLHSMLRDRAYIGDVFYQGEWHQGSHPPIVDRATFQRVQVLLGEKNYHAQESTYGSGMMICGHCGRPIVVEVKTKHTKSGPREYRYYRCAQYNTKGHPRVRVSEADLDGQVLALFDKMKMQDELTRDLIAHALRERVKGHQQAERKRLRELLKQQELIQDQRDELVNLRLLGEIEQSTFSRKQTEFRDQEAEIVLRLEGMGRQQSDHADLAVKSFELSQRLSDQWLTSDVHEKRLILDLLCLNCRLDDVSLVPTMRKPFDLLVEGHFVQPTRGDWI